MDFLTGALKPAPFLGIRFIDIVRLASNEGSTGFFIIVSVIMPTLQGVNPSDGLHDRLDLTPAS